MLHSHIVDARTITNRKPRWNQNAIVNDLLESRNLFNVQTIDYDLIGVSSTDLDPSGNFLLIGLSNGSVDLQAVQDPQHGILDSIGRINVSPVNVHRVQWNPGEEQFFTVLDNHTLHLVCPNEMRTIEKYSFQMKTNWSEWNPNDPKMIAVCGTESQVRLVDLRSGSSAQTIILSALSGLKTHRATRCLWSRLDTCCVTVGDNEGCLHVYDTRQSSKPVATGYEDRGQISGMCFSSDHNSIITTQGTENSLVQWVFKDCALKSLPDKFKKREKTFTLEEGPEISEGTSRPVGAEGVPILKSKAVLEKKLLRKHTKRIIPLPVDAYIKCQLYVTDRHVYCPVPARVTKSKELYIYDIESGYRVKTLKSDAILSHGVHSVTGLLPDALVLYVGGRGRLRVWTLDEDHQRKMEEKVRRYHTTRWDSDDEA